MKSNTPHANGQKLAYSYRRFSSRKQGDGSSLERQLDLANEVASAHGWQLVDLPPDAGVSAFKGLNRIKGTLGAFIEKVNSGEIHKGSVLIIEKLDRFGRDEISKVIPAFIALLETGLEIYSCSDRTHYTLADINKGMQIQYAVMGMQMANEYSRSLSERVSKSYALRIAEASKGHKMNFGAWTPSWIEFIGNPHFPGSFQLHPVHSGTVQRIVREYLAGKGMWTIAKGLTADKVPNFRKGKWVQGTVASILRSEMLTGDCIIKGNKFPDYYPAVISNDEYNALRVKLADNKDRKGGSPRSDYIANLFRNRCKCSVCGASVRLLNGYFMCRHRSLGTCASKHSIKAKELEHDFFGLFLEATPETLLGKHTTAHNTASNALKARLSDIEGTIGKTVALLETMPLGQLQTKLATLVKEKETLQSELEQANLKSVSASNAPAVFDEIKHYDNLIAQLEDNETRKRLLDMLPALVKCLEMNTTEGCYRIERNDGTKSSWQQVVW